MGAKAKQLNDTLVAGLSDIRFTDTNRVPFQFQKETRARYRVASITQSSEGPVLVDVDGGRAIDVSGSYGVNVCGYDAYKGFVDRAWNRVKDLGPNVLGPVHPIISDVLPALKKIANKEEVSFHMSGTEAVMCAVRLCRFNTGRKLIVQFAGAYHGWWDGVQPGPGSERANADVLYLNDMSPAALRCIAARADEIACVCVSPLQGLNLRGTRIFNPTSMCAYATVSMRALRPCFENSTRAIDSSKSQPNRLRCGRDREV
jgi:glutamate-1-semialdehyde 2,1-aminomutase